MRSLLPGVIGAMLIAATAQAAPPPDPVLARAGSIAVTQSGLRQILATLPDQARARAAADPAALADLLRNAVLQTALMNQARAAKFDRRPEVAFAAEQARQAAIVRAYVASQIPPPAPPTDDALQKLYEASKARLMLPRSYHLAQIFLPVPASATAAVAEAARQKLIRLRAASNGNAAAFADAAKRVSADTRSAPAGGDLGWIAEDKLVEPIKGAVAGMQENSVSDPLRTGDGWHLIELIATRPAGPATLDQARKLLIQAYDEQQTQLATRAYLDQMLQHDPIALNEAAVQSFAHGAAPP